MMQSPAAVDAAFAQLTAALTAQIDELKAIGSDVFYGGTPRRAQVLLQSAKVHEQLRDQITHLHADWKNGLPVVVPPPDRTAVRSPRGEKQQPGLIRNIKGVSERQAAEMLSTTPAKIRAWLESGALKGYRRVTGTWKIAQVDLVDFSRNHRELLVGK